MDDGLPRFEPVALWCVDLADGNAVERVDVSASVPVEPRRGVNGIEANGWERFQLGVSEPVNLCPKPVPLS